jgi:hypothetical protein
LQREYSFTRLAISYPITYTKYSAILSSIPSLPPRSTSPNPLICPCVAPHPTQSFPLRLSGAPKRA